MTFHRILKHQGPHSVNLMQGTTASARGDLDTAAMEAGAPEGFFCPISLKLFRDPVMLPTGQTCAPSPPLLTAPSWYWPPVGLLSVTALYNLLSSHPAAQSVW